MPPSEHDGGAPSTDGTKEEAPRDELGPAPRLLDDLDEQRRRELIRARLFGEAPGPVKVGRFAPLQRLGAGGMGIVYAAYDEQLERKVALKLLLSSGAERDPGGQERLLREAQALARLSHPNVVTIYDVGVYEGRVFIAMEYVRGQTLRAWLDAAPRDLRAVLSTFIQAGRGLAAAHDQQIVHKDFKPENVMVGDDGRARVLDFGLARAGGDPGPPERAVAPERLPSGTPAYMAPEQHSSGPVDARADQFAFCVALYEALFGERPFDGQDRQELARRVATGELRSTPSGREVPAWLRATVVRGLHPIRSERWPSMHALLAQLDRDRGATRRRWLFAAGTVAAAAVATWLTSFAVTAPERACSGGQARMREVWGEAQRAKVDDALRQPGLAYTADLAESVKHRLDEYAGSWVETRRQACLAHRRGEQPDELFDLQEACLEDRRREMSALVQLLGRTGDDAVKQPVRAAEGLDPVDRCADAQRLRAESTPLGPSAAKDGERLRERLAAARADHLAGWYEQASKEAGDIAADAKPYPSLETLALFQRGWAQSALGRAPEASASLQEAYWGALASKQDWLATQAAIKLLMVLGSRQDLFDEAQPWERNARALVERQPHDRRLQADFFTSRGQVRQQRGQDAEAEDDYRKAVSILEAAHGPDDWAIGVPLGYLEQLVYKRGDFGEALKQYKRILEIDKRSLGEKHPWVATDLTYLGMVLLDQGEHREALEALRRALDIKEKAFGPENSNLASTLNNLGDALLDAARPEEALEQYRRALRLKGPNELHLSFTHQGLGWALLRLGRWKDARTHLEQALQIRTRIQGAESPLAGETLSCLGDALRGEGRRAEAASRYQQALGILERGYDAQHPDVAYPLTGLGELRLAEGSPASAIPLLERAVQIRASRGGPRIERARARYLLARALVVSHPPAASLGRARELAEEALKDLEAVGPGAGGTAAEIRSWLEELHWTQ
ncbi:MAG TPA: serine/threonine-protein kinase [Myxococcaceae bacterium]|nr:serine/threonine-protein kinase [Myxococcaceae bacterium]